MRFIKIIALVCVVHFNLHSQAVLSVIGSLSVAPSNTVTNGTTIYVSCNIKNVSANSLTGTVGLKMALNIGTLSSPNYVFRAVNYFNINGFPPNAITTQTVSDVAANYNQYKTDGGGVVVVVWPVFNGDNSTTADTALTMVYVTLGNGLNDIKDFEAQVLKIQNPISQNTYLNYDTEIYKSVELKNALGELVQVIDDKVLNVQLLSKGLYYLSFYNHKRNSMVTKKIIVE